MLKTKMWKNSFVNNFVVIQSLFLLVYGLQHFAKANTRTNNVNEVPHKESLRSRPRQARLALQELNLIPNPDEEQRQNDKFLKNLPKVKIVLIFGQDHS